MWVLDSWTVLLLQDRGQLFWEQDNLSKTSCFGDASSMWPEANPSLLTDAQGDKTQELR